VTVATAQARDSERLDAGVGVTDCDVHNGLKTRDALLPYLPQRWHRQYEMLPGRGPGGVAIGARPMVGIFRKDSKPPGGGAPGSDLDLLREQLLDRFDVRRAILSPLDMLGWPQAGEFAHALAVATNDWLAVEWLDQDRRLYASIMVPTDDALRAAEEIRRVGADSRFVQILMTTGTKDPMGHARFWPIYEAAEEVGLPVAMHVGGFTGTLSGAGWVNTFFERHVGWAYYYPAQVISLIAGGVFNRFPSLQIVMEEGGMAWMPALMWRFDRAWEEMREDVAELVERPSATIRNHFWFTTQPMDEPEKPQYLAEMLEQLDMDGRVMFASDYPHWDFDPPDRVIPKTLGAELRRKIYRGNAETLYRFAER
jgi:predicted TIM-barrel fold metal-dependent hydrolase